MKADHEQRFRNARFLPSEEFLTELSREMDRYWESIAQASMVVREDRPFPMEIKALFFDEVVSEINHTLEMLKSCIDVAYRPAPGDVNWDAYHIGVPNHLTHLNILITHLEVRYLEQATASQLADESVVVRLSNAKQRLRQLAASARHVD